MTIEHKDTAIAVWVVCAVLLVVVVGLAVFLFCCQRRRRAARLRRRLKANSELELRRVDAADNTSTATHNPVAAHSGGAAALYHGFHRSTVEELEATPSPHGAWSFPAPLVVYLRVRPDTTYTDACDILLTVERWRDAVPADKCGAQLLGNDGFYHGGYLLYTAPLEFREPGLYVIHAHTVHPSIEVVGLVHRFTYAVAGAGGTPSSLTPTSPPLLPYAYGPGNTTSASIDIDLARRQMERAQAGGRGLQSSAHVGPSVDPHSAAAAAVGASSVLDGGEVPLPPVITPSGGEVTTSTEIVITPHDMSTTPDQLRYSVDGSYPTLLYTAPFTLSLPPPSLLPSQRRQVVVQAVAVRATGAVPAALSSDAASAVSSRSRWAGGGGGGGVSDATRAVLQVRPAGLSYFDPQVPTPSMRLRATDATLYFDESQNPPHTQTLYELAFVAEARRKVKFNRQRARVYDGQPIALSENVATVHAWTAIRGDADAGDRVRSVPTIYDCSRAATERGKLSRRRVEQYNIRPDQLLPPPVMCVACNEMELAFDDAPVNGKIAYTLNDTEPALFDVHPPACAVPLHDAGGAAEHARAAPERDDAQTSPIHGDSDGAHTYLYQPGRHIHVTQLETQRAYITARVFVPIFEGSDGALYGDRGAQGGNCLGSGRLLGYRYGGVFHRGFYFNNAAGGG
ncbi:Chitobiase/beta-hexosaminidase C-terminal domain containing protein [Novymonas esmeraldas]|uniref:Chitobiase/beta-hexosaminidase C-terminal domain containing protein n=1 Tax=Novymonas esmeraldas TaxID=1808958 RepID=A0AAW0EJS3_9TRYP